MPHRAKVFSAAAAGNGALPARYRLLHAAFERFCRLVFAVYCPLKIIGRDNLPPPPFVLCSNHCSHMDTPALMAAGGGSFGGYAMVAARDYFFSRGSRNQFQYRRFMFLVPVERAFSRAALRAMINGCRPHVQAGRNLIIYPEGTRSRTGEMAELRRGAALLALEWRLPVVPAHIEGTFYRLPKGRALPRPGPITVRFGSPLETAARRGDRLASKKIIGELDAAIRRLARRP